MAGVGLVYCPLPTVTHTPMTIMDTTTPLDGRPARLVLQIAATTRELPAVQDLKKLFGLAAGTTRYSIVYAPQPPQVALPEAVAPGHP